MSPKRSEAASRLISTSCTPTSGRASARGNVHYVIPSGHRADLVGIEDAEITEFSRADRGISGLFRMLFATLRAVHRQQPDVVHLHSSFAGLVLRPFLLLKRKGRGSSTVRTDGLSLARPAG